MLEGWQEGVILHRRPWRETSLWLELFTLKLGKIALLAKGARRQKGRVFEPFQPLLIRWCGKSELKTLSAAEPLRAGFVLTGVSLYCGLYLNELLCRLLKPQDPHPVLYFTYLNTLAELSQGEEPESCLRRFEVQFLGEIGYGLILDHEVKYQAEIDPSTRYRYDPERGPILDERGWLHGWTLLALRQGRLDSPEVRREAKRLLRKLIDHRLEGQVLVSRQLFRRSFKNYAL